MSQKPPMADHLLQKKRKNSKSGKIFTVKLDFELHDFSSTLSFDEIMDTLFIIGQYINHEKHDMFNKRDIPAIESWLKRNDLNDFFQAKQEALMAQAEADREKQKAKEIMRTPYRKESWH